MDKQMGDRSKQQQLEHILQTAFSRKERSEEIEHPVHKRILRMENRFRTHSYHDCYIYSCSFCIVREEPVLLGYRAPPSEKPEFYFKWA